MELWKNKDEIIWIMPLVTNNSDTPGFALCCHLPIKRMECISFHLIGADGCSTVQHHLQQVILLPSHWHTVYITSLLFGMHIFYKNAPRCSNGTLRTTTGKDEAFPPVHPFWSSISQSIWAVIPNPCRTNKRFSAAKLRTCLGALVICSAPFVFNSNHKSHSQH